jgi:hypothetical protein
MGQFIVHVDAVGNHGCQREVKDGEIVTGCRQAGCTDCITREYVEHLRNHGTSVSAATVTHWPGTESEVRDDLLTGKRSGSFG